MTGAPAGSRLPAAAGRGAALRARPSAPAGWPPCSRDAGRRAHAQAQAQAAPGGGLSGKPNAGVRRNFAKSEAAPAAPSSSSGAHDAAMGTVLRAIRLLEQKETALRDEMKSLLSLMSASAEALQQGDTSEPIALEMAARLERCVRALRACVRGREGVC